jgi:hypothetical protein
MRVELQLHVQITPDETLPGTMIAHVRELDVSTVLRDGEDPFQVLDDLVRGTLQTLSDLGKLEETLERLTGQSGVTSPPPELVAEFHLERRRAIAL